MRQETRALIEAMQWMMKDVPMSDWQPMDTAPKDRTQILLWNGAYIAIGEWLPEGYFEDHEPARWFPINEPTHWQPLPEPPSKPAQA